MKIFPFFFLFLLFTTILTILFRIHFYRKLKKQLSSGQGFLFTPSYSVWNAYLAEHDTPIFVVTVMAYGIFTGILYVNNAGRLLWEVALTIGLFFLYRQFLRNIPSTYGITKEGITILSWSPPFPIGPYGAGPGFIPWQNVTLCEMKEKGLVIFTEKGETRVVYTPEQEDEVCAFVDKILSSKGYHVSTPEL